MFNLTKVTPQNHKPDKYEFIGNGETEQQTLDVLRQYVLDCNTQVLKLSEYLTIPSNILSLAKANIKHNDTMKLTINTQGVVVNGSEQHTKTYYTVTLATQAF